MKPPAMFSPAKTANGQPGIKIYNAVYSSVQVYECMVRGIAVMRRRSDAYVNATQILKVAGIDKGRRTKILEKEILPGKHEIVQGGYGKYQGTWIPLERGRELATQHGVAPLLAPLFDFQPHPSANGSLPGALSSGTLGIPSRPLSATSIPGASSSMESITHNPHLQPHLQPAPILPGSALRLLNQGRAQGLFTPSTSSLALLAAGIPGPGGYPPQAMVQPPMPAPSPLMSSVSPTPPPINQSNPNLKRSHSQVEDADLGYMSQSCSQSPFERGSIEPSRPPSSLSIADAAMGSNPAKRPRNESASTPPGFSQGTPLTTYSGSTSNLAPSSRSSSQANGTSHANGDIPTNGLFSSDAINGREEPKTRPASKPLVPRGGDNSASLRDARRTAIIATIYSSDDPTLVLDSLRMDSTDPSTPGDVDLVLDDGGHTALHLAASMARLRTAEALLRAGADVHRGNHLGETALVRACLGMHCADQQMFERLVELLHPSIRTLDTSGKSVCHHVAALAGVKGRAIAARYYLDGIFKWIVQNEGGDFRSLIDLQDEHGDTALNVAARVGNRGLVKTLLDVGANRTLANKLGLRPGDFGVEPEELGGIPRPEDPLTSLRVAPSLPVQKSQHVITDMTSLIQGLSAEFSSELKAKQDSLDVTQAHLRAATRELSEQRRQIQSWQTRCTELDQLSQRIRNLRKALDDEDRFDWTGRTELDGRDARMTAGLSFQYLSEEGAASLPATILDPSFALEVDPPLPEENSAGALIRLRRMRLWQLRTEYLFNERLKSLEGANLTMEFQCKKIVALCAGIPVDKVEEMLDDLVAALESDTQIVDLGRVSGFMQKVRDGVI